MLKGVKGKHRLAGALIVVAVSTALVTPVDADVVGAVTQLTSYEGACSYLSPQLSENGQWVAAVSLCSTETGDQAHQIVRIERASGRLQMVTPPGYESVSPSLSGDGRLIAFVSNADLVPGQNPHHLDQVFLFDAVTHRYLQLTRIDIRETHRVVASPRIAGSGKTVVFVSNANLVADQNRDGNLELFVFDVGAGRLFQVTQTEAPARHHWPMVSHDGQLIAFLGIHPPFGKRPNTGVYVWSRKTGAVRRLLDTPYPDAGAFTELVMASRRDRLAFSGRYDLLGENPDRNIELFIFDVTAGIARQVTHTRGCTSAHPALSADGLRLLFVSNCRFGTLNPDLDTNLFLMRLDTGELSQVTDSGTSAAVETPTMDQSGRLLAVSLGAELSGMVNPNRLLQIATLNLPFAEPVAEAPPRLITAADVSGFLVSRHDPETLYLFGREIGIMKSQDSGRFWKLASFGLGTESVTCLVEHREQAGLLLAGTPDAGVYKTVDNGNIWVSANFGLGDRRILELTLDPVYPDVVYAETPGGLYWSTDQGEHWEPISDRITPSSDLKDSGVGLPEGSPRPSMSSHLVPVPGMTGRLLRMSESGLFLLSPEGTEWTQVKIPYAPRWVTVGPTGTPWLIGTLQGVYRADRLDGEWAAVSGLPGESVPPIAFGPGETVYAATRDGIYQSVTRGLTWSRVAELDDVDRLMPRMSPAAVLLAAFENGNLKLSLDGGLQWSPLTIPAPSPQGIQSVLLRPVH